MEKKEKKLKTSISHAPKFFQERKIGFKVKRVKSFTAGSKKSDSFHLVMQLKTLTRFIIKNL